MSESEALKEQRERILQALDSLMTRTAHDLSQAISDLYVDWGRTLTQERVEQLSEQLTQAGIEVSLQSTGPISHGDFYPVEHTISIDTIRGVGPTFDMALMDFAQKLLEQWREARALQRDLRAYINHDYRKFPSIDTPIGEQLIREKLLERVAKIIGEDK